MSDLTPEDLAFLKKIGQITETAAPKPATNKKDEE
jgi:hypothetical protein